MFSSLDTQNLLWESRIMRLASEYPEELVTKVQYECILEYIFSPALQPHKGIKIYQIDPLGSTS